MIKCDRKSIIEYAAKKNRFTILQLLIVLQNRHFLFDYLLTINFIYFLEKYLFQILPFSNCFWLDWWFFNRHFVF